eukprot:TRINITY_DN15589_c0_g1_i1.p1 TRINITY_DN15589_c0_g1~~TRINITY_DN15589_c0_g1_i1.p1  ORF type:complete len:132 (+),score=19.05 TRINITY_DN15589_c0_g1_i1:110-505(+)
MGLLLQIQVYFDSISGLGLELFSDSSAMLIVEVDKPPVFASGCIQPHSETLWKIVPDFTGGQASSCRQHIMHFSKSALNKPLKRLLEENPRLEKLARKGLSIETPLYFERSEKQDEVSPSTIMNKQDPEND